METTETTTGAAGRPLDPERLLGVTEAVFFVKGIEISMKLIGDEIRIYGDAALKVTPWATNSIRLSVETPNGKLRGASPTSVP